MCTEDSCGGLVAFFVSALLKVFRGMAERFTSTVQQLLCGTAIFWSVTILVLGSCSQLLNFQAVALLQARNILQAVLAFGIEYALGSMPLKSQRSCCI